MLIEMVNIIGPITLITLIGFMLGRSSVGLQSRTLSSLVMLVATPSLVFNTLTAVPVSGATIATMSGAALVCIAVGGVIALVALKIFSAPVRSFLPSLMLPNSGNMGLPLVILTFGPEGMPLGVSYFFVIALFQYSVGLTISSGTLRLSELARQPLLHAVLLVLLVTWLDLQVPQIILNTTEMLGGMMIPAMLILLGTSLATLQVSDLGVAFAMAVGRLLIGIIAAIATIYMLGLSGVAAGAVFLLATMPSAIVTYVFAERYQQNPRLVAGAVVMSTLLTFVCLPALVWTSIWVADQGPGAGQDIAETRRYEPDQAAVVLVGDVRCGVSCPALLVANDAIESAQVSVGAKMLPGQELVAVSGRSDLLPTPILADVRSTR